MVYDVDISIIVVNYNGRNYIDANVDSLAAMQMGPLSYEVIVVDNASTDDSVEYYKSKFENSGIERYKIIENTENTGFASANNTGAMEAAGRYLALLNNDTAVNPTWLLELYKNIHGRKDVGIVCSKLIFFHDFIDVFVKNGMVASNIEINGRDYSLDKRFQARVEPGKKRSNNITVPLIDGITDYTIEMELTRALDDDDNGMKQEETSKVVYNKELIAKSAFSIIQNAGSALDKHCNGYDLGFGVRTNDKELAPLYDTVAEVQAACGAAMMIRRKDYMKAGGMDSRFFMYYEDTDLSYRIRKTGKKILYCPESVVRHVHTGTSKEWSPFFTHYVYRNKVLFVSKNVSKIRALGYGIRGIAEGIYGKNSDKVKGSAEGIKLIFAKRKKAVEKKG